MFKSGPYAYVIYAPEYDETNGGAMALHQLCHLINQLGYNACLWPTPLCFTRAEAGLLHKMAVHARCLVTHLINRLRQHPYRTNPNLNTPLATRASLRHAIVVYPEIVEGNPLNSKRVVRWLLHRPGYWTGRIRFGAHDQVFYYAEHFNIPELFHNQGNLLCCQIVNQAYSDRGQKNRQGTCYIRRKGKNRTLIHDLTGSILVDDMTHAEMAQVFNRVQYCISYDPYTMLSKYAALCGCISIVIPIENLSKTDWRPKESDRHGIAYGFDDIEWAKATQKKVAEDFQNQQQQSRIQVRDFIDKTQRHFK